MINQEFYIAKLIVKSILEALSPEEEAYFEEWLSEPGNSELYAEIIRSENINDKFKVFDDLDKEFAYSHILSRITEIKVSGDHRSKPIFRNLYRYAAAAVLLFGMGYGIYHFTSPKSIDTFETIVFDLEPGYEKATLVLEDGTTMNLEDEYFIRNQSVAEIENSDNTLSYKEGRHGHSSEEMFSVGNNTLHVPIGGVYKLVLPDGTKVWLNSSTSLKYPVAFTSDQRIVELSGEAFFEVEKSSKEFIVKTKDADISVLGTSFNISAYRDDNFFAATLTEGKIKLNTTTQKKVFLEPGQEAVINTVSDAIEVSRIDTEERIAWIKGSFFFENERLDRILQKMGRWYNFETDFTDPELESITFTGLASKDFPVKSLLDRISKSTNVKYIITQDEKNEKNIIKILRKD